MDIDKEFNKTMHEFGKVMQKYKIHIGVQSKLLVPFMRFHMKIKKENLTKHNTQKNQSAFDRLEGSIETDKSVKEIMKEVRSNKDAEKIDDRKCKICSKRLAQHSAFYDNHKYKPKND